MRRSFRTLRLCAIPGVSPRAGLRCPVGALRTPHRPASAGPVPRSPTNTPAERDRAGTSIGGDHPNPSRNSAKAHPPPSLPASAGPIPRSPVEALIPSASPGTQPPQNCREHPGVCGVPSERSGCAPYPGFHPGLVYGAPLGHTERLTSPEPSCASTKRQQDRAGASIGTSTP